MKRMILTIAAFIFIVESTIGQKAVFIEFSGNYLLPSEMSNQPDFYYPLYSGYSIGRFYILPYTIKEKYETRPGVNLSVGQEIKLFNKFLLEPSVSVSWMKFKRAVFIEIPEINEEDAIQTTPGLPIGSLYLQMNSNPQAYQDISFIPSDKAGLTDILYLSIPVKIKYPIITNKLFVGAGVTASLVAWSSQFKAQDIFAGYPSTSLITRGYKDYSSDGINNLHFSLNISLIYNLLRNIGFSTTYNHGLSPIYDKSMRTAGDWKSSHISLGIRYNLR